MEIYQLENNKMSTKDPNGRESLSFVKPNNCNGCDTQKQSIFKPMQDCMPMRRLNIWLMGIFIIFFCIAIIIISEFDVDNSRCIASLILCILGMFLSIPNIYPLVNNVNR
nr:MAG: hypothetical protein [Metapenaeopsis lamellata majanivirus]